MKTTFVYTYKSYDIINDIEPIRYMATMEYITERKLTPIVEGKMEVPVSSLDPEGRYIATEAKSQP
jgi:hypothetical protein